MCGEARDKYICTCLITDGNFWTIFWLIYLIVFQTQTILSLLAEVDALHVIASIDHINAPLSE